MSYKMLCTDLDGTLLALKNRPSEYTAQVFKKYADRIDIVLVSARMPSGMRYIQEALGASEQPIICYNGALVMHGEKIISNHCIPLDVVKKVANICQELSIDLGLYAHDQWWVPAPSERVNKEIFNTQTKPHIEATEKTLQDWEHTKQGAHKLMLMGTKETADLAQHLLEKDYSAALGIYRSNDTLIELSPAGIDKLSGIKTLCSASLKLENIMAFGDNFNDISMLEGVGLGVAMENGREALKKIAQEQAGTCQEDGVAHFLEHYFNTQA